MMEDQSMAVELGTGFVSMLFWCCRCSVVVVVCGAWVGKLMLESGIWTLAAGSWKLMLEIEMPNHESRARLAAENIDPSITPSNTEHAPPYINWTNFPFP